MAAMPEIETKTERLVSRGKWDVPGYKVSYPETIVT